MENIRRYFRRTDKTYLLLCIFSSVMAVTALSSWAAKQGNGFAWMRSPARSPVWAITAGRRCRRVQPHRAGHCGAAVQYRLPQPGEGVAGARALTWGMVLPTLVLRNVSIGR